MNIQQEVVMETLAREQRDCIVSALVEGKSTTSQAKAFGVKDSVINRIACEGHLVYDRTRGRWRRATVKEDEIDQANALRMLSQGKAVWKMEKELGVSNVRL